MVPSELEEMVRDCKFDNPFNVVEMASEDFISFSSLSDQFLNTIKLKISSVSWIKITKSEFLNILTRQTFNEIEEWKNYHIFKKNHSLNDVVQVQDLSQIQETPTINEAKKKDLLAMVDYLDKPYKEFYRKIQ